MLNNKRHRSNDELTEVSDLISIVVTLFLVMFAVVTGDAEKWNPYDDFSQEFDAVDQQPGEVKFGKKWIRYVLEARLKMAVENGMLLFKVNAPGGRDPGFKLGFGWEEKDIIGIQFTVKVAELSKAGGWKAFAYNDIPENTNMLRTFRLI